MWYEYASKQQSRDGANNDNIRFFYLPKREKIRILWTTETTIFQEFLYNANSHIFDS